MQEGSMETDQRNISGFFTIDTTTRSIKKAWIVTIIISCVVLAAAVYISINRPLTPRSSGGSFPIYSILLFFVLPVVLIIAGIGKLFQKPGVILTGIRTTDSGFEEGTLTVDLASVEWGKAGSGRILAGNWKPGIKIPADSLVIVSLQQDFKTEDIYSFSGFKITSKTQDQLLYTISGPRFSQMAAVVNGSFQPFEIEEIGQEKDALQNLELIAEVLSTCAPDSSPLCTLNLEAKRAVPLGAPLLSPALLVYEWAYNKQKQQEMRKKFQESQLFDADTTERLLEFLNRRGWMITIDGE
jgi:hypothetical protein